MYNYILLFFFFLMILRPPRSTPLYSSAASDVYKRQLGDTYYTAVQVMTGSVPFPSAGDVAYLGFDLLMIVALIAAVRGHARGLASSVWLDCAVGSLGVAA